MLLRGSWLAPALLLAVPPGVRAAPEGVGFLHFVTRVVGP